MTVSASQSCSRLKWANSCQVGFCDLCTSDFLGWLCFGPVHCGVVSSTLGFYSLDPTKNSLPSVVTTQDRSRHCHVSPWGPDGSHRCQRSAGSHPNCYPALCIYCSGEGSGTPLQHSCLENPMDGGAWWAAVHGVAKSRTRLSDFTFTFHFHFSLSCIGEGNGNPLQCSCLENPRDREPGGLPSMGSHRVGHD